MSKKSKSQKPKSQKPGSQKPESQKSIYQKPIEQYEHSDTRLNNPPVGLVTPRTDPDRGARRVYKHDPHLDPQLSWAGKAEGVGFEVPTVSLHVHERIDPKTIVGAVRGAVGRAASSQESLFEQAKPLREALDFYRHEEGWSNRLVAGDSLLVMNSLLEKENMGGKVQMVYMDPPYGIKYRGNFQPFVDRREARRDDTDANLTAEPETLKAFRDTWELGIHSYLTYLRDRLLLARELLTESGSVFVQIGDENVHRVGLLMDDIFGAGNRMATISFATTSGSSTRYLPEVSDYLLWYAKDKNQAKYRQLYEPLTRAEIVDYFSWHAMVELPDGTCRKPTDEERLDPDKYLPKEARIYRRSNLASQGHSTTGRSEPYEWNGRIFHCPPNGQWRISKEGMDNLSKLGRLEALEGQGSLMWKIYEDETPGRRINNIWHRQMYSSDKKYVVETATKPIQRCILMTTDPGDLVFDPTCGSGTTAYVAEEWGRRWITCDTSRVALTLAKQRLMTATFDYYQLAYPDEGVRSGFKYKETPKVSAALLGYGEPPRTDIVYDQPLKDPKKTRISGLFTVEAVPAPYAKSVDDELQKMDAADAAVAGKAAPHPYPPSTSLARQGETHRQSQWREELLRTGVRAKGGEKIRFGEVEPLGGTHYIQATATTAYAANGANGLSVAEAAANYQPQNVFVVFGPEHAPLEQRQVEEAWKEARTHKNKPDILLFCAFQFDEEAAKDIDHLTPDKAEMQLLKAQMNADLLTDDLRRKRASNESFWLIGQPDVKVISGQWLVIGDQSDNPLDNGVIANYECVKKFSGLDSLAEIQGLSREDLCFYIALSSAGDLWYALADAAGSGIGAAEHSGGAGAEQSRGIQTFLGHRARLDGGVGDLDRIIQGFESTQRGGFRQFVAGLRNNSEVVQRLAQVAKMLDTDHKPLTTNHYRQVEVLGFDYYNPTSGEVEGGGANKIAVWMLDTDYDGRALFPRQVFFPMAGPKDGWSKLAKNLRAEIDADKIDAFKGTLSLPFELGEQQKIAVKIVDDRGIESLWVQGVE